MQQAVFKTVLLLASLRETSVEIKFKRFEPLSNITSMKIQDLLNRGGRIIVEKLEYIEILRYQSIARVDQHGRVEWRAHE